MKKLQKTENLLEASGLPFRVLYPEQANRYYSLELYQPTDSLRYFVQLYWVMRWELQQGQTFDAQIIPSAYTNVTCMPGGARVTGVTTGMYNYKVQGSGTIFGIMFKAGGLAPFYKKPLKELTDTYIPAQQLFQVLDDKLNEHILTCSDSEGLAIIQKLLEAQNAQKDPNLSLIQNIIEESHQLPSIMALAKQHAMSERKLQLLFEKYVGVGLKWIMLRDKLQKTTLLADTLAAPNWTNIAHDLGYNDQPHFINDFKRIVGMTPKQYAKNRQQN